MATNPTNSTTVNIRDLPTAQLAVDSDNFILQTNNGTQIISFEDLNVVKADIFGNATVVGNLSGGSALFSRGIITPSVSAYQFVTTNGATGFTQPLPGTVFYDSFTITNGLVTSAIPTSVNFTQNPMYQSLFTQITAASANLVTKSIYKNIFAYDDIVQITGGSNNSGTTNWTNLPGFTSEVNSRFNAGSFSIMPGDGAALTFTLSTVPFITGRVGTPGTTTGNISFVLNAGMVVPTTTNFRVRVLIAY